MARRPLRILSIGADPGLMSVGSESPSDSLERHAYYVRVLREECGADSELRVVTYWKCPPHRDDVTVCDGFKIYPSNSRFRSAMATDLLRRAQDAIRHWRPDLITTQDPMETGWVGLRLSARLKCPFLPQLHFDLLSSEWLRERWLNRPLKGLAFRVLGRARKVRVVSKVLAARIADSGLVPADQVYVAPVAIAFQPTPTVESRVKHLSEIVPRAGAGQVVLFVGRFCAAKNLDSWVAVAAYVLVKRPDVNFVLAGDGPERLRLQEHVSKGRFCDRFHFLGNIDRVRLPKLYRASDVFFLSSSHEGYGRVIIEAFLSGVPVVSTRTTGALELIEHERTGLLSNVNDVESAAANIIRLLDDKAFAKQIAATAMAHATKTHSLDAVARRLVETWALAAGAENDDIR